MTLALTTYSACRGYSWSATPLNLSPRKLNQFYRMISSARGDFPDPSSVDIGLVSDGKVAAVFTLQNVEQWDSEKRASEYAALAVFPVEQAAEIDFVELINDDFFWTPSHKVKAELEYSGPASADAPASAVRHLQSKHSYLLRNPRAIGAVIAKYASHSNHWTCMMKAENILKIVCNNWK